MAARAVLAEFAAVDVVAAMAVDALTADFGRIASPGMTGRADQPFVVAGEWELGRGVMVK